MESDLYYRSKLLHKWRRLLCGLIVYPCSFYCLLLLFYTAIITGLEPVAE